MKLNMFKVFFAIFFLFVTIFCFKNRKYIYFYNDMYRYKIIKSENIKIKVKSKNNEDYSIYGYEKPDEIFKIKLNFNKLDYWSIDVLDEITINKKILKNGLNELKYEYSYINKKSDFIYGKLVKSENINCLMKEVYTKTFDNYIIIGDIIMPQSTTDYYLIYVDPTTKIASEEAIPYNIYHSFVMDKNINVIRQTYKTKNNDIFYEYHIRN